MPDKAVSKKQFRFFQGVKHGSIQDKGFSPQTASELLGHQSPQGLPETAPKKKSLKQRMFKQR
jgi:hypothetical protein